MNDDEQFAQSLRTQVTRVAPQIDVDVTHVVPAARRRRAARVGGVTLAMGLALGGGAWAATTLEAPGTALPGGSTTTAVEPSPEPSGPPVTSSAGDRLMEESGNLPEDPILPPEGWRDATYFHVVTRGEVTKQGEEVEGYTPLGIERWYGDGVSFQLTAHGPELLDIRGYITFEGAEPISFTWAELADLPTEPNALHQALLTKLEPMDMGEDGALDATARLITDSPAPAAVRAAAWDLLTTLPGVEVEQEDRPGTTATFAVFDRSWTITYDEDRDVPLRTEKSIGKMHEVDLYVTTEFTDLPDEVADSAIEIPDFTAMTREDAEVACLQQHLACTFEDTESDTVPEGTVISSDPEAGALVTWGAPVTVLLSTGS
jgi:hypothetical protein